MPGQRAGFPVQRVKIARVIAENYLVFHHQRRGPDGFLGFKVPQIAVIQSFFARVKSVKDMVVAPHIQNAAGFVLGQGRAAFHALQRIVRRELPQSPLLPLGARHSRHLPQPELRPNLRELIQAGYLPALRVHRVQLPPGRKINPRAVR